MDNRAHFKKCINRLTAIVICFAFLSGQMAAASFDLDGGPKLTVLKNTVRGLPNHVSENLDDTRFRAVTDASSRLLEVELTTGESTTSMTDRRDGIFQKLTYVVRAPLQTTKFDFKYSAANKQYDLKRVSVDERKLRYNSEPASPIAAPAPVGSAQAAVCAPKNPMAELAFETAVKAASDEIAASGKIKKSCEKKSAELAMSLAEVRTEKPNKFLNCAAEYKVPGIAALRLALFEKEAKNSLSIECSDSAKSVTFDDSNVLTFGRDALDANVSAAVRTDIVFHELLHFAGTKEDTTVDVAVQCCGSEQNAEQCKSLKMLVDMGPAGVREMDAYKVKEHAHAELEAGGRGIFDLKKATIAAEAAKQADAALATPVESTVERAFLTPVAGTSAPIATAANNRATAATSARTFDPENVSGVTIAKKQALPEKMTIQVGAADNVQTIKPTIAKYKEFSEVLGRQVGKLMDRVQPTLVSTANAAPIYRSSSSGKTSSSRKSASNPSRSSDGDIEFSSVSGQVSSMRLPDGELKSFSIPFSQNAGFGEAKIVTTGSEVSRLPTLSKSSVASPKSQTNSLAKVPPMPSMASRTSGVSTSSSETGASVLASAAPANKSAAAVSVNSSSGSGSAPPAAAASAAFLTTAASNNSAPKPRAVQTASSESAPAFVSERPVASWKEARDLLVTSPDPKQLLVRPWFQKRLVTYKTQVVFQGVPYGPKALKTWKLDPYWKKTP